MTATCYRITVDGHGVTMLAAPGTTLAQARKSAVIRFGESRVTDVKPITINEKKPER